MDTMPIKPLATLLRVLRDQGYPVETALRHIDLDFNPLAQSEPCPDRVATASYSKLYALVMQLHQDEAFGLGEGYRSPPGTFRMMCLFIIHCRTLEQALRRAWSFYDYCDQYRAVKHPDSGEPLVPQSEGGQVLWVFQRGSAPQEQVVQANVLLMMYRFYSWLAGKPLPLTEVYLQGAETGNSGEYEALFDCEVRFGQPLPGLLLPAPVLQLPVVQDEDSLRDYLRQTPYQLVRRDPPGVDRRLSDQVERILTRYASGAMPGAREVASALNMSARTLHRRLTLEGTSFQQLKDGFRAGLAKHYLGRPELSIDAIATLMGFQDNSAFYRSFRKWTGMSPGEYRRSLAA